MDVEGLKKSSKLSTEFRNEGNKLYVKSHNDETHMQILSLYSKSIAFALENSEELGLAYGNRSALLLHMQKYKECITDIDMALRLGISNKLKSKLLSRKNDCLEIIRKTSLNLEQNIDLLQDLTIEELNGNTDQEKSKITLQKCSLEKLKLPQIRRSKKVHCFSEFVSVNFSNKYGRYVIANQDIDPGQIIAVEEGYVAFPYNKKMYVVCSHCLSIAWNAIPCDFCVFAVYCSEKCQQDAWEEYHDIECHIIHFLYDAQNKFHEESMNSFYGALKFFLIAAKREGLKNIISLAKMDSKKSPKIDNFSCNSLQFCCNLESNSIKTKTQIHASENIISWIIELLNDHTTFFDDASLDLSKEEILACVKKLVIKLENIIHINSCNFQGKDCDTCEDYVCCGVSCEFRGVIVTPCCSLFNHSCDPNVGRIFVEKKTIVLFTTYPVKKGEQLFINYGPTMLSPKQERQIFLQQNFGFDCNCRPCAENWPVLDEQQWMSTGSVHDKICQEYEQFCSEKQLPPVLFLKNNKEWSYDAETLKHVIKLIEITCKYLNGYSAAAKTQALRYHIYECFINLYGIEHEKSNGC